MRVAEALLHNLREQLQEPLSPALQRQLIEALVEKIEVGTMEGGACRRWR
jgi:hypothetical protein